MPKSCWLMLSFWQKTQPREQPEKKTVPVDLIRDFAARVEKCYETAIADAKK